MNQQNAQINSGLIYYWSITPTCFGPSVEAIIREFDILESYKAIVLICWNVVMYMCSRRDMIAVGCLASWQQLRSNPSTPAVDSRKAWQYLGPHIVL